MPRHTRAVPLLPPVDVQALYRELSLHLVHLEGLAILVEETPRLKTVAAVMQEKVHRVGRLAGQLRSAGLASAGTSVRA